ncbi:hypothetical protein PIROE2DRAFT_3910, partial [Piromyces sp. E2]
ESIKSKITSSNIKKSKNINIPKSNISNNNENVVKRKRGRPRKYLVPIYNKKYKTKNNTTNISENIIVKEKNIDINNNIKVTEKADKKTTKSSSKTSNKNSLKKKLVNTHNNTKPKKIVNTNTQDDYVNKKRKIYKLENKVNKLFKDMNIVDNISKSITPSLSSLNQKYNDKDDIVTNNKLIESDNINQEEYQKVQSKKENNNSLNNTYINEKTTSKKTKDSTNDINKNKYSEIINNYMNDINEDKYSNCKIDIKNSNESTFPKNLNNLNSSEKSKLKDNNNVSDIVKVPTKKRTRKYDNKEYNYTVKINEQNCQIPKIRRSTRLIKKNEKLNTINIINSSPNENENDNISMNNNKDPS